MKHTCNNFVLLSIQITIVEFGLNKSSDTDFRTLPGGIFLEKPWGKKIGQKKRTH